MHVQLGLYSIFPSKLNCFALQFQLKSAVAKIAQSIGRGKQFSPIVFYGSHGVPPKKPTRMLWRLLREIRVDLSQQKKLNIR